MKNEQPEQIMPRHFERLAVDYVRLACYPAGDGEKRIEAQLGQVKHARQWGWSEQRILVIDDIGQSGTMTAALPGFRQLCQLIEAGHVGLVLVSDLARLSRSMGDLLAFLRLCHKKDTLVAVDGVLLDPSTMYLRESSPRQVARNVGSAAYQRQIREIFRYAAEGYSVAEIAEKLNPGEP